MASGTYPELDSVGFENLQAQPSSLANLISAILISMDGGWAEALRKAASVNLRSRGRAQPIREPHSGPGFCNNAQWSHDHPCSPVFTDPNSDCEESTSLDVQMRSPQSVLRPPGSPSFSTPASSFNIYHSECAPLGLTLDSKVKPEFREPTFAESLADLWELLGRPRQNKKCGATSGNSGEKSEDGGRSPTNGKSRNGTDLIRALSPDSSDCGVKGVRIATVTDDCISNMPNSPHFRGDSYCAPSTASSMYHSDDDHSTIDVLRGSSNGLASQNGNPHLLRTISHIAQCFTEMSASPVRHSSVDSGFPAILQQLLLGGGDQKLFEMAVAHFKKQLVQSGTHDLEHLLPSRSMNGVPASIFCESNDMQGTTTRGDFAHVNYPHADDQYLNEKPDIMESMFWSSDEERDCHAADVPDFGLNEPVVLSPGQSFETATDLPLVDGDDPFSIDDLPEITLPTFSLPVESISNCPPSMDSSRLLYSDIHSAPPLPSPPSSRSAVTELLLFPASAAAKQAAAALSRHRSCSAPNSPLQHGECGLKRMRSSEPAGLPASKAAREIRSQWARSLGSSSVSMLEPQRFIL